MFAPRIAKPQPQAPVPSSPAPTAVPRRPVRRAGSPPVRNRAAPPIVPWSGPLFVQRACAECDEEKEKAALPVSPKLLVGSSSDPLEREADRVADQLMSAAPASGAPGVVQNHGQRPAEPHPVVLHAAAIRREADARNAGAGEGDHVEPYSPPAWLTEWRAAQKREAAEASGVAPATSEAPSLVHSVLRSGGGAPLDPGTRADFEPKLGIDLGSVRVHTGSRAAESAQAINARAYTSGTDVVFGTGQYSPQTSDGKRLLAHELAHVAQQQGSAGGVRAATIHRKTDFLVDEVVAINDLGFTKDGLQMGKERGASKPVAFLPPGALVKLVKEYPETGFYAVVMKDRSEALPDAVGYVAAGWIHRPTEAELSKPPKPTVYGKTSASAAQAPKAAKQPESKAKKHAAPVDRLLSTGVALDLDMNGGLTSKEVHLAITSDDNTIQLTLSHVSGVTPKTLKLTPKRIKAKGARYRSAGVTDGIHPLEIVLVGTSTEDEDKTILDTIFIAPDGAPGKYAVMEGDVFDPKTVERVDLGVAATFRETAEKVLEQSGDPTKEGGIWEIDYQVGPKREVRAALHVIKDPDKEDGALCYFAMSGPKAGRLGIQSAPSGAMKVPLPVTFEEMTIEKSSETNSSVTYRFLPPGYARGMLVTYEMNPLDPAKQDATNAIHGLNVYALDTTTGSPDSIVPAAKAEFAQVGGNWQIHRERRTVESFRVESAKDALAKLPRMTLAKNELTALTGEMSLLATIAVEQGIASRELFEQWVELSFGVTVHGPKAAQGDETARTWLREKSDLFLKTLLNEIGSRGTTPVSVEGATGPVGAPVRTSFTNKYTGGSGVEETQLGWSGKKTVTTTEIKKPFEDVRALFGACKYEEALSKLRASYYLWIEDLLLENGSQDKATKDRLKAYGHQMSYRRQLKNTLAAQAKPLQKVRALYYPDMTNVTGPNPYERKWAGVDEIVSTPLDIYYQDTGTDWVLYNFTTLTEPGKLNGFKRTWAKQSDESAPPQEMFDLLTKDEGIGKGYIHYQTETGPGGIVRVDHPWTVGGVLLGTAAVAGFLALALTGVGLLVEGAAIGGVSVAGAAAVVGDIAMMTALAGGSITLASNLSEGAPVTAGQVAGLALDVALAVMPVIRSARSVAALRRWKGMFVVLDDVANTRLAAKLELAANATAMVVGTERGVEELVALSQAVDEGRIDPATFYWAVVRNVGLGLINVVLLRSGFKTLEGRTLGNTTVEEVVQKSMAKGLLEVKPTAMYTAENLEAGIKIMQDSSSVHRSMVLEALSNDSKLEKAVDVLCYLGKKGRGSLEDVTVLDGKVRRVIDVLVEGKFFGKTLSIPQGFIGSKAEPLDETPRDFGAFSKAVVEGVHAMPGLANAEVRMQGSATMGIVRPKKGTTETEAAGALEGESIEAAGKSVDKPWDIDLAIMVEPGDFLQRLISTFKGRVKYASDPKVKGSKEVPIDIEKMSADEIVKLAQKIYAEDVAELPHSYNSASYTFANAIVTGKANSAKRWNKDINALIKRLKAEFKLPDLDLSIIAKNSGFDSHPFIELRDK